MPVFYQEYINDKAKAETLFYSEFDAAIRLYKLHKKGKPRLPIIKQRLEQALEHLRKL